METEAMHLIQGTWTGLRKLRPTAAIAAIAAVGLALPAAAQGQVTVSGYPVVLDSPPAGSSSLTEPALTAAPDGSDAEWFVVSGRNQAVLAVTPTGQQSLVASGLASDAGTPANFASVSADGYDWVLDNDQGPGNVLYAIGPASSASPGVNPVARFGDYGQDITLGPDGSLYVSDNDGIFRCQITAAPSATCTAAAIPSPFYTGAGAFAVGGGGNAVWFTDGNGELGAYTAQGFSGPYPSSGSPVASTDPGTIVSAPNGYVYVAAGAGSGAANNDRILVFSPGDPQNVQVAASGLGDVVAMSIGPDGNVWFLDDSANGSVGQLNITTGAVAYYPLPSGLSLPQAGWRIANGPSIPGADGTGEVFFTAATAPAGQGSAAIGIVRGIPFPVAPGALAFKTAVTVSKSRVAVLTFSCSGQSNAACAGTISLSVRAHVRLRGRAARKGGNGRHGKLTQTRQLTLGSISYNVHGGQSLRPTVRLSSAAYRLLEAAAGHSWNATVSSTTTVGTVSGSQLTMTGPTPPQKPKKPRHKSKRRR